MRDQESGIPEESQRGYIRNTNIDALILKLFELNSRGTLNKEEREIKQEVVKQIILHAPYMVAVLKKCDVYSKCIYRNADSSYIFNICIDIIEKELKKVKPMFEINYPERWMYSYFFKEKEQGFDLIDSYINNKKRTNKFYPIYENFQPKQYEEESEMQEDYLTRVQSDVPIENIINIKQGDYRYKYTKSTRISDNYTIIDYDQEKGIEEYEEKKKKEINNRKKWVKHFKEKSQKVILDKEGKEVKEEVYSNKYSSIVTKRITKFKQNKLVDYPDEYEYVRNCVLKLDEVTQKAIIMYYWELKKLREIAEVLNIKTDKVYSVIKKGKRKIMKNMISDIENIKKNYEGTFILGLVNDYLNKKKSKINRKITNITVSLNLKEVTKKPKKITTIYMERKEIQVSLDKQYYTI